MFYLVRELSHFRIVFFTHIVCPLDKYLLLTEFEVDTVKKRTQFVPLGFMAVSRTITEKLGPITFRADRENEKFVRSLGFNWGEKFDSKQTFEKALQWITTR